MELDAFSSCALSLSLPIMGAIQARGDDSDLMLLVSFEPGQITLRSGDVCCCVDSVVYVNPEFDSVFHALGVDSVSYQMPKAVLRTGIWSQPSPKGIAKPRFDNDFVLQFGTDAERDAAYTELLARDEVMGVLRAVESRADQVQPDDSLFSLQWGLENTGQEGGSAGFDIGAKNAWEFTTD